MGSGVRFLRLSRRIALGGLWSILASMPAAARANDAQTCIAAHADGQVLRDQRKLLDAREKFVACVAEKCPALVRNDCAEFLKKIETSIPSVVLAGVDEQGRDTTQISVKIDGRPAATELQSTAIALDPGQHEFEFTARHGAVQRVTLVLREAEKHRPVVADFRAQTAPVPPPVEAEEAGGSGPPVVALVLGGVGLAALGSFAYFATSGRSIEKELDRCKPNCEGEQDRIDGMRTRYVIADVSLGVSLVSLGLGTFLWLTHTPPSAPAASASGWHVGLGSSVRGDFSLTASGRF
jgi:hypothetical protein